MNGEVSVLQMIVDAFEEVPEVDSQPVSISQLLRETGPDAEEKGR